MCKDKTDDRNSGGQPDPRGGLFPHIGTMPERRPIRRGGGLWGGEGDEHPPRFAALPALLVLTTLAMCGEKRYFGDDRVDEHILFKRDLEERKRKRNNKKDGGGGPFPWSFRRLVELVVRRPVGA